MKNSTEEEEKMYKVIQEAILSLCHNKPDDPTEFLAAALMELSGQKREDLSFPKIDSERGISAMYQSTGAVTVSKEKVFLSELTRKFYDNYTLIDKVGQGTQGEVYLCSNKKSPEVKRAVKIINKESDDALTEDRIRTLKDIAHTNLVTIYEIFDDEKNTFIVEEFCEKGDLLNFIKKNANMLNKKVIKQIVSQLMDATFYLHQKGIIHRDIKPENILTFVDEKNEVTAKLCDFGTMIETKSESNFKEIVGSPYFMSPEMLNQSYNEKSDVWSIGAVAYFLLSGETPYKGKNYDLVFKIINNDVEYCKAHSKEDIEFLSLLLNKDQDERISLEQLFDHPYIKEIEETSAETEAFGLGIIEKMTKFTMGNSFKRAVFAYIKERKLYEEKNNELHKLFKSLDSNRDGTVDIEELYKKYGDFFPGTPQAEWSQIKALIGKFDIDGTGSLDYSEFMLLASQINKQLSEAKLKEIFDFFDNDGDNYIDSIDLNEVFEDQQVSSDKIQSMIDEYDTDGDRRLSFEEFVKILDQAV